MPGIRKVPKPPTIPKVRQVNYPSVWRNPEQRPGANAPGMGDLARFAFRMQEPRRPDVPKPPTSPKIGTVQQDYGRGGLPYDLRANVGLGLPMPYMVNPAGAYGPAVGAPAGTARGSLAQPYLPVVLKQAPAPIGQPTTYQGPYAPGYVPQIDAEYTGPWTGEYARGYAGTPYQGPAVAGGGGGYQAPRLTTAQRAAQMAEQQDNRFWQAGAGANWVEQYKAEHGGASPSDAYGQNYEGLQEALADIEWGEHFEQQTGEKPSEYDWRAWWFQKRGISLPETRMSQGEYRQKKERWAHKARKRSRVQEGLEPGRGEDRKFWWRTFGDNTPMKWSDWIKLSGDQQGKLIAGAGGATRPNWGYDAIGIQPGEDVPAGYSKPPLWVPPRVTWR